VTRLEGAVTGALVGAAAATALLLRAVLAYATPAPAPALPVPSASPVRPGFSVSLNDDWPSRAPFRRDRRVTSVSYTTTPSPDAVGTQPPAPPKPQLLLRGLVVGRDPSVILEGVPGTDGPRVMRLGDTLGGLRVRGLTGSRVVVAGFDTTWQLTFTRPGP
jgi:hypothetical protein